MRARISIRAIVTVGLLFATVGLATPAFAEGEVIGGTLIQRVDDERSPVEGVVVVVSQDGSEIGSATSGPDGVWEVPLPGPGQYDVRIDVSTLPPEVELTNPESEELTDINVTSGQKRSVAFPLGESSVAGVAILNRAVSLFIVGLKLGAIIALCAVGLSLVFAVTGLINFAHAEAVTIGAVAAYAFHALGPRWPLALAALPAIAIGGVLGFGLEKGIWRPLRDKGMGLLSMMVVSIGLGFALRFLIRIYFGGRPRAYPDFAAQGAIPMLGVPVVPKQLVTIGVALVLLAGVGLFLQRTQAGTALRAVRDNPDLSESSGINVNHVIANTWIIGSGLAAIGGVFFGLTESVQWDMGFVLLLLMFSAVVLGGIGTAYGAMLGGFVVGVTVEMSTLVVPSELKPAIGLLLLIVILIFKPQGILGVRERIG